MPLRVSVTQPQMDLIDSHRGTASRSEFIRALINAHHEGVTLPPKPERKTPEPPIAPDEKVDTTTKLEVEETHWHRFVKDGPPVNWTRGEPQYRRKCTICGIVKTDF